MEIQTFGDLHFVLENYLIFVFCYSGFACLIISVLTKLAKL